jgi:hypothetical protein
LLAKAYEAAGRSLEAAQAYQSVINEPTADPQRRGDAAARAGLLFLRQKMPLAAVEIGVKALMIEGDNAKALRAGWSPATGAAIRLMLARGFFDRGDYARSGILLQDYLTAGAAASPDDTAIARLLLARSEEKLGRAEAEKAALDALLNDAATPPLYADQAREMQKLIAWDKAHPRWAVLKADPRGESAATTETAAAQLP